MFLARKRKSKRLCKIKMPEVLSTENIAKAVSQIIGLHQNGADLMIKVWWRTKGKEALLPGDEQEWTGFVHKVQGGTLYLEFIECPERYTEIPRDDIDYCSIVEKMRDVTMHSNPIIKPAPVPTQIASQQIEHVNPQLSQKRARDDEECSDTPYVRLGTVMGGFKVPASPGRFSPFYPSYWVAKMFSGISSSATTSEWKNELADWLASREHEFRSFAAKTELDDVKSAFGGWLSLVEVLLRDKKYSVEDLPDACWKLGHQTMESLLKIIIFSKKGIEGTTILRSKLDSMHAKSKVEYASVYDQVMSIKVAASGTPPSSGPTKYTQHSRGRGGGGSFRGRKN